MKASVNYSLKESESEFFGGPIIQIEDWVNFNDFLDTENQVKKEYKPLYIYCAIESTNTLEIHKLEKHGYLFSEFRIHSTLNLSTVTPNSRFFPYQASLIGDKTELKQAISILLNEDCDDRYSNDEQIGKELAQKRNIENLNKSYNSHPREFVLGVFNSQTEEMVAFRSGEFINSNEVIYYQYGIKKNMSYDTVAGMLEAFTIDFLAKRKVKLIHSVSTGFNIKELNRLIKNFNFKIHSTKILLRKYFG